MVARLGFHPARKALVESQVVPPCHGDEIAEPLVRDLMRLNRIDRLSRRVARDLRVVEQDAFEGEDRAPIFHRAEKLRLAGPRDIVELGQRIGLAEIIGVIAEQRTEAIRSEEHTSELQSLMRNSYAVFCLQQ